MINYNNLHNDTYVSTGNKSNALAIKQCISVFIEKKVNNIPVAQASKIKEMFEHYSNLVDYKWGDEIGKGLFISNILGRDNKDWPFECYYMKGDYREPSKLVFNCNDLNDMITEKQKKKYKLRNLLELKD